jgi:phosphoribosylaminoimidazolecarboxamide formyltransferase/IMP cyclohydrolase
MDLNNIKFNNGENAFQKADIELNEKTIDYEINGELDYISFLSLAKGLNVISEFYDVKAACSLKGTSICAVALGQSTSDAVQKIMDSNPIDFMSAVIVVSSEVDSEIARFLKNTNIIAAPSFTKNAVEILTNRGVKYVKINTPLKDYKNYISNSINVTPLGTLIQTPNLSELDKDLFKVVSKEKPTVEQIEDAVFAWKVAKHISSQAIVIAKDMKTTAIAQGLQTASVEFALDYSCDSSKEAILASDMPITMHDIDVASQGRISMIIVPSASKEIIEKADKYGMSFITTGFTNILY